MTTVPETAAAETAVPETTVPETTAPPDPIRELLDHMTLEERVGQLFLARHPRTGAAEDLGRYHLGGYILFAADFEGKTPGEIRELLQSYQDAAAIPMLIAVDEEGALLVRTPEGLVRRVLAGDVSVRGVMGYV